MACDGETPTLGELLQDAEQGALDRVHKALPCQVVTYDAARQCADVQPVVQRIGRDGAPRPMPIIPCVPVLFPAGSVAGARVCHTWPLTPGDLVAVHFFSAATAQYWISGNAAAVPEHQDRNAYMEAFAVPGLSSFTAPLQSAVQPGVCLGFDDGTSRILIEAGTITITAAVIKLGSAAALRPAAFGDTVDANNATIATWAAEVVSAMGGIGVPVPPLGALTATSAAKVFVE